MPLAGCHWLHGLYGGNDVVELNDHNPVTIRLEKYLRGTSYLLETFQPSYYRRRLCASSLGQNAPLPSSSWTLAKLTKRLPAAATRLLGSLLVLFSFLSEFVMIVRGPDLFLFFRLPHLPQHPSVTSGEWTDRVVDAVGWGAKRGFAWDITTRKETSALDRTSDEPRAALAGAEAANQAKDCFLAVLSRVTHVTHAHHHGAGQPRAPRQSARNCREVNEMIRHNVNLVISKSRSCIKFPAVRIATLSNKNTLGARTWLIAYPSLSLLLMTLGIDVLLCADASVNRS